MTEPHPLFVPPENVNAKIWRYMDFTKYVSMLAQNNLYFSRADLLGDPFEGSFAIANSDLRFSTQEPKILEAYKNRWPKYFKWLRTWTFVNCWHLNEYESAAMWKLYAKTEEAVAIQSTFNLLHNALPSKDSDENPIFFGKVHYLDYEQDPMNESNQLVPYVCKRKSFAHENEVRAVLQVWKRNSENVECPQEQTELGISIPVNLSNIITKVYVAPTASEWFRRLVVEVAKKYGLEVDVFKSSIDEAPFY